MIDYPALHAQIQQQADEWKWYFLKQWALQYLGWCAAHPVEGLLVTGAVGLHLFFRFRRRPWRALSLFS